MFFSQISMALSLIAVAAGVGLFIYSMNDKGWASVLGRVMGMGVSIVAFLVFLSSLHTSVLYQHKMGYGYSHGMSYMNKKCGNMCPLKPAVKGSACGRCGAGKSSCSGCVCKQEKKGCGCMAQSGDNKGCCGKKE